jgi:hypothetical protein
VPALLEAFLPGGPQGYTPVRFFYVLYVATCHAALLQILLMITLRRIEHHGGDDLRDDGLYSPIATKLNWGHRPEQPASIARTCILTPNRRRLE